VGKEKRKEWTATHGHMVRFEEERLARFMPTNTWWARKNIIFWKKENACDSFNFVVGSVEKKYGATKEILPLQSLW
jgi:hypothetical protein